jgi:hypothetical protein
MEDIKAHFRLVAIPNRETHTLNQFNLHLDEFAKLKELVEVLKNKPISPSWGEGVDSAAVLGISLLFDSIPLKFPVTSLLIWLRDEIDPSLPLPIVEDGLIQLARLYV